LLAVIVAVATRQMPQRRLALRLDILLVIIYVERRLCRVLHPPDDDGGDFDRVAALVVDLELLPVERARPQGDLVPGRGFGGGALPARRSSPLHRRQLALKLCHLGGDQALPIAVRVERVAPPKPALPDRAL